MLRTLRHRNSSTSEVQVLASTDSAEPFFVINCPPQEQWNRGKTFDEVNNFFVPVLYPVLFPFSSTSGAR